MALIAGAFELDSVVERLRVSRSLYHSEADFQHTLAVVIADLGRDLRVRLEVPSRGERSRYLDVDVTDPASGASTAVELKYVTERLETTDPITGEEFRLRAHAATDLARLGFVRDISRLEGLVTHGRTGIALMVSNVRALWSAPSPRSTKDRAFRIHEGTRLAGRLVWGRGDCPENDVDLSGSYVMSWHPYATLEGSHGTFQWLAVEVRPSDR